MRKSRVLGLASIGLTAALVAACSGSSSPSTGGSSGNNTGGGSTTPSSSSSSASSTIIINPNSSGTPVKGGTLNMLGTGDVDYMDPNISYYTIGALALRMWSRQLITYPAVQGKTTTDVPDLATEIPTTSNGGITNGGKEYKFTIKTGAMWDTSPARQITAADEVRGVKRTCNPAQPFGGLPDYEDLIVGMQSFCDGFAKVSATSASAIAKYLENTNLPGVSVDPKNPQTVIFKLTHPAAYFLPMLSMPAFSPAPKEYDQYIPASSQLAQNTISDGPYKVSKYQPTKELDFVRNSSWKSSTDTVRKAYVNAIDINETGDQDAIQQQLQANTPSADMEFDSFPPTSAIPGLIQNKDPNFNLQPSYSTNPYILFNTVSPNNNGALKKVAVRQALSEAINRDHMIAADGGPAVSPPLTHILPAGISGAKDDTSPSYYPYNTSKAKSDLAAAGASNMTLKFLYRPESSASKAIFLAVQQDLSQVGITVKGVGVPSADFYTKYLEVPDVAKRGTWDLSLAGWGPDWYGDSARSFFAPLFYGNGGKSGSAFPPNGSDFGFYDNPKVDALINKASTTASTTQSSQLWQQADQLVMKDAAIYPITDPNQPNYHSSAVHNTIYVPGIQNFDPTNVWLSNS